MALPEQKKKRLKAKIAITLNEELGKVPKKKESEQVFLRSFISTSKLTREVVS